MPFIFLLMLPALEIYLFIKVGEEIGALAVIVWLLGAVILGMNILRYLGATAMLDAARKMQAGEAPAQTLMDALVKAIAAILLIIPGFATDFLALLLLIPPIRHLLLKSWMKKLAAKSSMGASFSASFGESRTPDSFAGNVYEHKGSTQPIDAEPLSGRILDHKPDDKN